MTSIVLVFALLSGIGLAQRSLPAVDADLELVGSTSFQDMRTLVVTVKSAAGGEVQRRYAIDDVRLKECKCEVGDKLHIVFKTPVNQPKTWIGTAAELNGIVVSVSDLGRVVQSGPAVIRTVRGVITEISRPRAGINITFRGDDGNLYQYGIQEGKLIGTKPDQLRIGDTIEVSFYRLNSDYPPITYGSPTQTVLLHSGR